MAAIAFPRIARSGASLRVRATRLWLLVASGLVCGLAWWAPAARGQPRFRAEVVYVELQAVVTAPDGTPVTGLTADEVEVREAGRVRPVARLEEVAPDMGVAHDPGLAASNRGTRRARKVLLLLDDWHVAPSATSFVQSRLRDFVDTALEPGDYVGVVFTSGADPALELTRDRRAVREALGRFQGRFRPPERGLGGIERSLKARRAMHALRRVCEFLRDVEGWRAVLLVSEGWEYELADRSASLVADRAHEARRAALDGGIPIYAFDPSGLAAADVGERAVGVFAPEVRGTEAERQRVESLRAIVDSTGGAVIDANEPGPRLFELARAAGHYYIVGYYAGAGVWPGARLEVAVRRAGARVEVRLPRGQAGSSGRPRSPAGDERGVAAGGEAAERRALDALLSAPVPEDVMTMRAQAVVVGPGSSNGLAAVSVVADLDARGLAFRQVGDAMVNELAYAVSAVSEDGRQRRGRRNRVALRVPPPTLAADGHRIRLVVGLEVPPGRYNVRLAVLERGTGRAGSVFTLVEALRARDSAVPGTSILVASRQPAGVRALTLIDGARPVDGVDYADLRLDRVFDSGEEISVLAVSAPSTKGRSQWAELLLSAPGEGRAWRIAADESPHASGALSVLRFRLPLAELRPGRYTASVRPALRDEAIEFSVVAR